ncbi:hypothetical protein FIBSPDRAFT_933308 [Athelia psychrophila]|uniref:Uncharacterized protein n=1 Tax=Athelia psychrophila TaxID=1759441 RepID=A0A166HD62_9AGAM|nr:hypothetical protein FIBSPDRAFT_933308 [Fibularhizoctonia sp. CBS 109695]
MSELHTALVATSSRTTAPAPLDSALIFQNASDRDYRTIANGPGMHLNLAFNAGAPYVEAVFRQCAKLLGLGPAAASETVEAFFGDGAIRLAKLDDLYARRSGEQLAANADPKTAKSISKAAAKLKKLCAGVLKYTDGSQLPETRLSAFKSIVTLTTRYIGLRALFIELLVPKSIQKPMREDIARFWRSSGQSGDQEWEFFLDYAAYCLAAPDAITSVVDTLATTELSRLIALRYLAGILEMHVFWENRLKTDFQSLLPMLCALSIRLLQDLAVESDARGAIFVGDLVTLDPEGIHRMIYAVMGRLPDERSKVLFPQASREAEKLGDIAKQARLREGAEEKAGQHPSHRRPEKYARTSVNVRSESISSLNKLPHANGASLSPNQDPAMLPNPESTLVIPDRGSLGPFGPRTPRDSPEPALSIPDGGSPGLFTPMSPHGSPGVPLTNSQSNPPLPTRPIVNSPQPLRPFNRPTLLIPDRGSPGRAPEPAEVPPVISSQDGHQYDGRTPHARYRGSPVIPRMYPSRDAPVVPSDQGPPPPPGQYGYDPGSSSGESGDPYIPPGGPRRDRSGSGSGSYTSKSRKKEEEIAKREELLRKREEELERRERDVQRWEEEDPARRTGTAPANSKPSWRNVTQQSARNMRSSDMVPAPGSEEDEGREWEGGERDPEWGEVESGWGKAESGWGQEGSDWGQEGSDWGQEGSGWGEEEPTTRRTGPAPANLKPAWRTVTQRSARKKRSPGVAPQLPPPIDTSGEPSGRTRRTSWATWQPDPAMVPTPTSAEPTLLFPDRGSPGLFGPRSPRDSLYRQDSPDMASIDTSGEPPGPTQPTSWATWQPALAMAPSPSPSPIDTSGEPPSPGLFGPRSPPDSLYHQ